MGLFNHLPGGHSELEEENDEVVFIRKLMDGRGGNEKVTGVSNEVIGLVY